MASESTTSNVMLKGQSAYIRKDGSMIDYGIITITDTNSSHTYTEGFIAEGSKINGTKLEDTTDYQECETAMKTYLADEYIEPAEGEYSIVVNANNISTKLTEPCTNIQSLVDKIV